MTEELRLFIDALISGKKRLVVHSVSTPHTRHDGSDGWRVCFDYKHTFSIENVKKGTK